MKGSTVHCDLYLTDLFLESEKLKNEAFYKKNKLTVQRHFSYPLKAFCSEDSKHDIDEKSQDRVVVKITFIKTLAQYNGSGSIE